jgi:hypothetical protein
LSGKISRARSHGWSQTCSWKTEITCQFQGIWIGSVLKNIV